MGDMVGKDGADRKGSRPALEEINDIVTRRSSRQRCSLLPRTASELFLFLLCTSVCLGICSSFNPPHFHPARSLIGRMPSTGMEKVKIGGEEVSLYNDKHFVKIRDQMGVRPTSLSEDSFSFLELNAGGGKGGSLMQFTRDGALLVKQLSKDDHDSLCEHFEAYCNRILQGHGRASLLARIYFHFYRPKDKRNYVVMSSIFPPEKLHTVFDLKGCADDKIIREKGESIPQVHKRWFMVHWLVSEGLCDCILPSSRIRYKQGKTKSRQVVFNLLPQDCRHVVEAAREDVKVLKASGLMDYSLIVGVIERDCRHESGSPSFPPGGIAGQPYVVEEGGIQRAYYIGIIDFLQGWTFGKKVAHVIKYLFAPKPISTIKPDLYADQFIEANDRRFQPVKSDGAEHHDEHKKPSTRNV
mmetsp:Transcript_41964/g.132290  ORF Transcript_41964/g.132290 Transcript_41964/m.132290 type:complete len:412 (-) Transcript_41964:460-1695(-)